MRKNINKLYFCVNILKIQKFGEKKEFDTIFKIIDYNYTNYMNLF